MKLRKIDIPLAISAEDEHLLIMHSLYNILNVLAFELTQFGELIKNDTLLSKPISLIKEIRDHLDDKVRTTDNLEKSREIIGYLHSSLVVAIESEPNIFNNQLAKSDIETIIKIIDFFKLKCERYLDNQTRYLEWKECSSDVISEEVKSFFRVVSAASRHNFGVTYHAAHMNSNDYYIKLDLPENDQTFKLPMIFIDIIIDLMANARKYAAPYTTISLKVAINESGIDISVIDKGRGIPEDEILEVIKPKYRARNSMSKRSMGGGYGLTKAYHFTKKYGGEFYIGSELHKGTIINILLPR